MVTETDRLRELLDERGVGWEALSDRQEDDFTITGTQWHDGEGGLLTMFISEPHGSTWDFFWLPTPEQAIAATLGAEDTYTREDVEGAFVSGYSLGCLPVGSDPQWDENRQTVEEHMAELGWTRITDTEAVVTDTDEHDSGHVRNVSATLGSGTCHPVISDNLTESEGAGDAWADCSECGHLLFVLTDPNSRPPRYCPNCGRRVEVDG